MPKVKAKAKPRPRRVVRPRRRRMTRETRRALLWASPLAVCVGIYGLVMLSRTPAGADVFAQVGDAAIAVTARMGLVVDNIEVTGRETTERATIIAALGAERGTPILAVDPGRAKQKLQALPWVRSAAIERRLPGTLFVRLVERKPLAVWQHDGKQQLIGRSGEVIPVTDLSRFSRLPTVVGADAPAHARELLDMLASEPKLAARVTAAIRVGGRRWDLRIDHAIDVMLPEEDPAAAWERLGEAERSNDLLQRDVRTIDLRLPDRLVIRTIAAAPKEVVPAKKPHSAGKPT
ncbi:MAG TPA: FtsQ-type POTRA domain-containing protein [Stellaceae bacterium]|nr:FtsQ-type POTRA domain-containing protein [Stellaceae bacterium]